MAERHHDDGGGGGYPSFETVDELPRNYQCSICLNILYEPQQIAECGHRFCQPCLRLVLRGNAPLCPNCKRRIDLAQVFPDLACKRTVQELQVKCLNSSKGCEWTGELANAQRHRTTCPLEKIKCTNDNCEEMIERRNEQRHCQEECVWRKKTCPHCDIEYAFCQEQEHLSTCQMLPIACLHECDLRVPRCEMTNHINNQCPNTAIDCPYSAAGCELKMQRCELEKHLSQSCQFHLDLTLQRLHVMDQEHEQFKREMERKWKETESLKEPLKERLNRQEMQLQEMKHANDKQEKQLQEMKHANDRQEKQLQEMKHANDRQEKQLQEMKHVNNKQERQIEEMKTVNDKQANKHQQELQDVNNRLFEQEKQLKEMVMVKEQVTKLENQAVHYDGKLIWVIDNYQQRLSDAKIDRVVYIYSSPFYSGRCGYKVRCQVSLNGQGSGDHEGSHVSIFIQLLQGQFDALLPWPFSRKVVFTLINQTKENKDIVEELVPEGEDSFQRPKTEKNVGFGYGTFASHETIKNGGYLKDDVIFIKMEVEPFDLMTNEIEREIATYDGKLIWCIDRYQQRLSDAKIDRVVYIYSSPFYSGRCGYKVRCQVYLNGKGHGKGSHVSIYIQLLQGQFDALLPWPFSRKVVFTLINQTKGNKNIVMELVPEGEDNFQRPKTEANVGWGYRTFASHETVQNGGYLKDDVIFIKVEVEP